MCIYRAQHILRQGLLKFAALSQQRRLDNKQGVRKMAMMPREILFIEGGYDNDPADPGGETKYGICKRQYPNLDIKALTEDQALEIYKKDYWGQHRLDDINSQVVANVIFYLIVNLGAHPAITLVQRALVKYHKTLVIDGAMGSKTIYAINSTLDIGLDDSIRVLACAYYLNLVTKNHSLDKFFKGWIRRALT
jgi:lysozyme family protein